MRSAPTLKIWMTPFASVARLEKLALLKIALCRAPPRAAPLPPAWLLNCYGLVLTHFQFVLVIAVQVDLGAPRFTGGVASLVVGVVIQTIGSSLVARVVERGDLICSRRRGVCAQDLKCFRAGGACKDNKDNDSQCHFGLDHVGRTE